MRSEVLAALNELEPPEGWVVLEEATATDPNERPLQEQGGSARISWQGEPTSPSEARDAFDAHFSDLGFVRVGHLRGQTCDLERFGQEWASTSIAVRVSYNGDSGIASLRTLWTADWRQTLEDVVPRDELPPCEE